MKKGMEGIIAKHKDSLYRVEEANVGLAEERHGSN
jgi:ATP-dependent DNA ligase